MEALKTLFAPDRDWFDGADFRGALGRFLGLPEDTPVGSPCMQ